MNGAPVALMFASSVSLGHAGGMSAGRAIEFAVVGLIAGGALGGGAGLLGGLGHTALAETSGFEGYSGFVVGYWMLAGILLGAIAGVIGGIHLARRQRR